MLRAREHALLGGKSIKAAKLRARREKQEKVRSREKAHKLTQTGNGREK